MQEKRPDDREQRTNRVLNAMAAAARDPHFRAKMFRARVGGQLAALVAGKGATAASIAKKSGIKPSQLSKQLSGDCNLTLDSIFRIAEAAGATVQVQFDAPEVATRANVQALASSVHELQQRLAEIQAAMQSKKESTTVMRTVTNGPQHGAVNRLDLAGALATFSHSRAPMSTFHYQPLDAANEPQGEFQIAQYG